MNKRVVDDDPATENSGPMKPPGAEDAGVAGVDESTAGVRGVRAGVVATVLEGLVSAETVDSA